MATNGEHFYYSPKRDIIGLSLILFWAVLLFFIWKYFWICFATIGGLTENQTNAFVKFLVWFYVITAIIIIILKIFTIHANTYRVLVIRKDEIVYFSGWLTQTVKVIPIRKITNCFKSSGILQRNFCDSCDIHITASGDTHEICFMNIKNGNKAHMLISKLIIGYVNKNDIPTHKGTSIPENYYEYEYEPDEDEYHEDIPDVDEDFDDEMQRGRLG